MTRFKSVLTRRWVLFSVRGRYEYTLRKTAAVSGVTSLVIGVSKLSQLEDAVRAMSGGSGLSQFYQLAKEKHAEVRASAKL
jgi:hypothetical protein